MLSALLLMLSSIGLMIQILCGLLHQKSPPNFENKMGYPITQKMMPHFKSVLGSVPGSSSSKAISCLDCYFPFTDGVFDFIGLRMRENN